LSRVSNGTLFLDCIEVMSRTKQQDLRCLLDEVACHGNLSFPGGGPRIISGATCSLLTAISVGTFEETLFYRLNVIHVDLTGDLSQQDS
jgi:DNA-binding NtrC family response regulator